MTVVRTVTVPEVCNFAEVATPELFAVYEVFPTFTTILEMVEEYASAATTVALTVDKVFTYRLKPEAVPSASVTEVMEGFTEDGTVTVNVLLDVEPTCVPPLVYVVNTTVIVPVVAFGNSFATSAIGIVYPVYV